MSTSSVLGVVLLVRHGDRQGFYQDPTTYTASSTAITALGAQQHYQLGQYFRSLWFNASSPNFITGISTGLFKATQIDVRADAGGEGGVIYDSVNALVQGLWPNSTEFNTTLADGTLVHGPLGGYQYVPIESVEPDQDISLEGWTSCAPFVSATNDFYASPAFKQKQSESADFLASLPQYLDGRPAAITNMWNIYDYMNVNDIHNGTFHKATPPGVMQQARALADWHEYGVFTSPALDGIGNIAGRTALPPILENLAAIANASNPLKFTVQAASYKPFLSLFNMTSVAAQNPQLAGIVDYAAALALEVRQEQGTSEPVVRFLFKNGTNDDAFGSYKWMNASSVDVPLSTVMKTFQPVAINTTLDWCHVCGNTKDRGCGELLASGALAPGKGQGGGHRGVGAVGAGFIGMGVTLAVCAAALAVLAFLGLLTFGRKSRARARTGSLSLRPSAEAHPEIGLSSMYKNGAQYL